eukprot:TRINITY_DN8033_c3_g1_i1.p1 TRINITY_DN8033_c3_g1~~TRINITY_DN8033_c3_g1_i1.p1  ORF type:complete len:617 (+),score=70.17 TRINITY_DN8033_c3_g1_i1:193-1851(+)
MACVAVLSPNIEDFGDVQELAHLNSLAGLADMTAATAAKSGSTLNLHTDFCESAKRFAETSQHGLLYLSLRHPVGVLWTPSCRCCRGSPNISQSFKENRWREDVKKIVKESGLQLHEQALICWPNRDCSGELQSVALLDQHQLIRNTAALGIANTTIVVFLMTVFATFFMHALNKVNTRMLHPLWSILDDMASLRSLEVVRMTRFQPASEMLKDLRKDFRKDARWRRCLRMAKKSIKALSAGDDKLDDAAELTDLRSSLSSMRSALRSWAKYVPPYLQSSLYRSGVEAAVGVRHTEVSVFFCDIDGFRDMCRDLTPQDVLDLLKLVHGEVSDAIEDAGGTLLEFVGDEVLAVFNAPSELPRHPEKAVSAAAEVCNRSHRLGVNLRCGVHSARVLVGNIGAPTRIKYGVLGDGVNVAARLKSLTSHYGVHCLVSDECLGAQPETQETYLTRPLGNLILKGRKAATRVWEVQGSRSSASQALVKAYDLHSKAFELYLGRQFSESSAMFAEVCNELSSRAGSFDLPSRHLHDLSEQFADDPPPDCWDGSESLSKK